VYTTKYKNSAFRNVKNNRIRARFGSRYGRSITFSYRVYVSLSAPSNACQMVRTETCVDKSDATFRQVFVDRFWVKTQTFPLSFRKPGTRTEKPSPKQQQPVDESSTSGTYVPRHADDGLKSLGEKIAPTPDSFAAYTGRQ